MNDRKYLIIPVSEVHKIIFDHIHETHADTLHHSGDHKRTFIKWTGDAPDFVANIVGAEGPYTHEEIKEIIRDDAWLSPKRKSKKK